MKSTIFVLAGLAPWFVLNAWIFPKLGVRI